MRIFIVRHAESYSNVQGKMMSSTDLPLTEKGIRQAGAAKEYLRSLAPQGFHQAFSSPLIRAKRTAEIICAGNAEIKECDDLREMNLGLLEGLTWEERARLYPDIDIESALSDAVLPAGENFLDIKSRCGRFFSGLDLGSKKTVLIVSHGITLRVLINCLLDKPDHCVNFINWADNTAVCEIEISASPRGAFKKLKRLNDMTHLTVSGLGTEDYVKWGRFAQICYTAVYA